MKAALLVFLFTPGHVEYQALSGEPAELRQMVDSTATAAAFDAQLRELAAQPGARVCAVVPDMAYASPLQARLSGLLAEKGDALPGIWEVPQAARDFLDLRESSTVTMAHVLRLCSIAETFAFD